MAYTTDEEVQAVLLDDYATGASLTQFIKEASVVMGRLLTCASAKGYTLTAEEKEVIEANLAAHFYCCSDRPYASRSTEGASGSFVGQTGMYFEATQYGQKAMKLDPSGCLEAIGKGARNVVRGVWLGRPPSEQRPYVERD